MAAVASGLAYATESKEGVALNICNVINTVSAPEYPALPFALGTRVEAIDGAVYVYCKPAGAYAVGSVVIVDTSWSATKLTATNGASGTGSGLMVGVMSQVASTVASPSSTNYEGVWVQVSGLCPAIQVAASASANVLLYATATGGQLDSSGSVAVNGIVITTANGGSAGTQPGVLIFPQTVLS